MDTAGVTDAHMQIFKFDKAADTAAQNETNAGPIYDIGGEIVKPTADAQRIRHEARIAAQMKSHKNPKNRVY
jgi:hypothetical protein